MLNVNKIIFTGNLVRQPELRCTGGGNPILSLTVAINNNYKDKQGEWVDKTCFIDCSIFGKAAEAMNNRLDKGSHVYVEGKLDQEKWTDKNSGQNRSKHSIKVDRIALTQKENNQNTGTSTHSQGAPQQPAAPTYNTNVNNQQQPAPTPPPPMPSFESGLEDSDIPF